MRRRGSIPVAYWPSLVGWAKAEGIQGVIHESLVLAHARPRVSNTEGVAGAAA